MTKPMQIIFGISAKVEIIFGPFFWIYFKRNLLDSYPHGIRVRIGNFGAFKIFKGIQ